jgi:hypothetical protein
MKKTRKVFYKDNRHKKLSGFLKIPDIKFSSRSWKSSWIGSASLLFSAYTSSWSESWITSKNEKKKDTSNFLFMV